MNIKLSILSLTHSLPYKYRTCNRSNVYEAVLSVNCLHKKIPKQFKNFLPNEHNKRSFSKFHL